eukprot:Nk52_evm20s295 gene=Nk52_evmTU20s295
MGNEDKQGLVDNLQQQSLTSNADLFKDNQKKRLRKELLSCFSNENVIFDAFLTSQMDADHYIPLNLVAQFKSISDISGNDPALTREVIAGCDFLEMDSTGEKFRKRPEERHTLILRDVEESVEENDIRQLFLHIAKLRPASGTEKEKIDEFDIVGIVPEVANVWFVHFADVSDALLAHSLIAEHKSELLLKGCPVYSRLKSNVKYIANRESVKDYLSETFGTSPVKALGGAVSPNVIENSGGSTGAVPFRKASLAAHMDAPLVAAAPSASSGGNSAFTSSMEEGGVFDGNMTFPMQSNAFGSFAGGSRKGSKQEVGQEGRGVGLEGKVAGVGGQRHAANTQPKTPHWPPNESLGSTWSYSATGGAGQRNTQKISRRASEDGKGACGGSWQRKASAPSCSYGWVQTKDARRKISGQWGKQKQADGQGQGRRQTSPSAFEDTGEENSKWARRNSGNGWTTYRNSVTGEHGGVEGARFDTKDNAFQFPKRRISNYRRDDEPILVYSKEQLLDIFNKSCQSQEGKKLMTEKPEHMEDIPSTLLLDSVNQMAKDMSVMVSRVIRRVSSSNSESSGYEYFSGWPQLGEEGYGRGMGTLEEMDIPGDGLGPLSSTMPCLGSTTTENANGPIQFKKKGSISDISGNDPALTREVIAGCDFLEMDSTGEKFRKRPEERHTLILRDVEESVEENDIRQLFLHIAKLRPASGTEKEKIDEFDIVGIVPEVANVWFVHFADVSDALLAHSLIAEHKSELLLKGCPVYSRLKSNVKYIANRESVKDYLSETFGTSPVKALGGAVSPNVIENSGGSTGAVPFRKASLAAHMDAPLVAAAPSASSGGNSAFTSSMEEGGVFDGNMTFPMQSNAFGSFAGGSRKGSKQEVGQEGRGVGLEGKVAGVGGQRHAANTQPKTPHWPPNESLGSTWSYSATGGAGQRNTQKISRRASEDGKGACGGSWQRKASAPSCSYGWVQTKDARRKISGQWGKQKQADGQGQGRRQTSPSAFEDTGEENSKWARRNSGNGWTTYRNSVTGEHGGVEGARFDTKDNAFQFPKRRISNYRRDDEPILVYSKEQLLDIFNKSCQSQEGKKLMTEKPEHMEDIPSTLLLDSVNQMAKDMSVMVSRVIRRVSSSNSESSGYEYFSGWPQLGEEGYGRGMGTLEEMDIPGDGLGPLSSTMPCLGSTTTENANGPIQFKKKGRSNSGGARRRSRCRKKNFNRAVNLHLGSKKLSWNPKQRKQFQELMEKNGKKLMEMIRSNVLIAGQEWDQHDENKIVEEPVDRQLEEDLRAAQIEVNQTLLKVVNCRTTIPAEIGTKCNNVIERVREEKIVPACEHAEATVATTRSSEGESCVRKQEQWEQVIKPELSECIERLETIAFTLCDLNMNLPTLKAKMSANNQPFLNKQKENSMPNSNALDKEEEDLRLYKQRLLLANKLVGGP